MTDELWFLTLSGPRAMCELTFETEKEAWAAQKLWVDYAKFGQEDGIKIVSIHGTIVLDPKAYTSALVASYSQVISRSRLVRMVQEDANKPDGPGRFVRN